MPCACAPRRALRVLTSSDKLGDTGKKKTGFWREEHAAPYYVSRHAGCEVTLASPKGGQPPPDPTSDADDAQNVANKRSKGDTAGVVGRGSAEIAGIDAIGLYRAQQTPPYQYVN